MQPPVKTASAAVLRFMNMHGGGFVQYLAFAWMQADATNSAKLMQAFGDLYDKHEASYSDHQRRTAAGA